MRTVSCSIQIHASPAKVISSFLEPEMLQTWWGVERTLIEKKEGGLYILGWKVSPSGFGYVSTGIIKKYDASSELFIDQFCYLNPQKAILGPMFLGIRAQQTSDGSVMHLDQGGYQDTGDWNWYHDVVKEAWPKVLESLKDFLEGH